MASAHKNKSNIWEHFEQAKLSLGYPTVLPHSTFGAT